MRNSESVSDDKTPATQRASQRGKDEEPGVSSSQSPRQSRTITTERILCWYTGILGNISLRTKSKVVGDTLSVHSVDRGSVCEERIIIFRPSFIKNQYELQSIDRCGKISRALSTDCVVDFKAPVFDMCRSGDIRGLEDAFTNRNVYLNVVNPLGMGLLHVSTLPKSLSSSSDTG